MTRSTERKTLHQHLITSLHTTANQSQMNGSSTCTQANHLSVKLLRSITLTVGKRLQILFEGIHIRSHWYHPVGIDSLLHIFLFQTSLTHMSKTQVNCFSFFHCYIILLLFYSRRIKRKVPC